MTRVLVLRPEPGATATVERARARGLDAVVAPLFAIEPVDWKVPDPARFDALLLTSANAVRSAGDRLRDLRRLKVFAIGDATAAAASDAGFEIAAIGDWDIDRLLGSIDPALKLLHLCGVDRREPSDPRQEITPVPVYRSAPIDYPDLSAAPDSIALIHSPRAGRRFAALVTDRSHIAIAAISAAAAAATGPGWKAIAVADRPSDDALLALAARLCNKPQP